MYLGWILDSRTEYGCFGDFLWIRGKLIKGLVDFRSIAHRLDGSVIYWPQCQLTRVAYYLSRNTLKYQDEVKFRDIFFKVHQ
jgi:hypothetical protein